MLNILFLASESHSSNSYPLCLHEYKGKTLLQYFVDHCLNGIDANYTFVFQKKDISRHHLDSIIKTLRPNANMVTVKGDTGGSACTALYAACGFQQNLPLLIVSTNEIVEKNYAEILQFFDESGADGGVMTFNSVHPRYSYAKLVDSKIIEFFQQNPVSNYATTGSFWFRKTEYFVDAAKKSIFNNCVTSEQFYIAPVYNQMILAGMNINRFDVTGAYLPFKENIQSNLEQS